MHQPRRHVRIHDDAARSDHRQGAQEVGDLRDAVLEQVTQAAATLRQSPGVGIEQFPRILGSDVLADQQQGDGRIRGADPQRGPQPVVGQRRRHPHVGDHHIDLRGVRRHLRDQFVRVAGARQHRVTLALQESRDALTQQRRIVGDDDLHPSILPGVRGGTPDSP